MSTDFAERLWPACLSALQLDRWLAGELDELGARRVQEHVADCSRCAAASAGIKAVRDERLPPLRVVPLRAPARRGPSAAVAGAGLAVAAAAALLLLVRPPGERVKGTGFGLGMYVEHAQQVRRAGPGETIAPGDAVRFVVTAPVRSYVAVLSLDPAGRASIYFPLGARAEAVAPGVEVALPLGTRLDATVGEERIVGLFCASPVELEPLRVQVERGEIPAPGGCQVTRWSFVKR
jgi:Domain of unknown function (DUF4384)/Putative zinc-finger